MKVVDKLGNYVFISAEYLKVPHKCHVCSEYGHSELRCPDRHLQNKALVPENAADPAASVLSPVASTANPQSPVGHSTTPDLVPAGSPTFRGSNRASHSPSKIAGSLLQEEGNSLRRSLSLPDSKAVSSSRPSGGSLEWIPVVHRTPSARAKNSSVSTSSVKSLTSAQFSSEEELISAAQSILRKRIAAAEAELPPFATAKDRRRIRYQQRQAMVKLCNNLDASSSHSPKKSSPVSDIPNVVQRESSPNGKSSPLLEA